MNKEQKIFEEKFEAMEGVDLDESIEIVKAFKKQTDTIAKIIKQVEAKVKSLTGRAGRVDWTTVTALTKVSDELSSLKTIK